MTRQNISKDECVKCQELLLLKIKQSKEEIKATMKTSTALITIFISILAVLMKVRVI